MYKNASQVDFVLVILNKEKSPSLTPGELTLRKHDMIYGRQSSFC